jgi:hypothetical protein
VPDKQILCVGDQLSLKNALNILGRQSNATAKNSTSAPMPVESASIPHKKGSIVHLHLQKLLMNPDPPPTTELAAHVKGTTLSSTLYSASGRAGQSQDSARSRPYNSNFSYLFEEKGVVPSRVEFLPQETAPQNHPSDFSTGCASNPVSQESNLHVSTLSSNVLKVQAPHPPASHSSEQPSSTVDIKRRKYAVISTANFNPLNDAGLTVSSLPCRPQSHKPNTSNRSFFAKHVASGTKNSVQLSSIALSEAHTEIKCLTPKNAEDTILQSQYKTNNPNSARVKGNHSVVFHLGQAGPSLDCDLEHGENLNFSMSPWKIGAVET